MIGHRKPLALPPRIGQLATLPLFWQLKSRKALVIGVSDAARWKVELLLAAGADLLVLAGDEAGVSLLKGALGERSSSVTVLARAWSSEDLAGAAIIIAEAGGDADRLKSAAQEAGVPINFIDRMDLSDFTIGTIVNRSPIVVGISTSGAAPVLGQSIRARVEAILPLGLSAWAAAALSWRPLVKKALASFEERRFFWRHFAARAWAAPESPPSEAEFPSFLNDAGQSGGRVTIAGAGPGDPELLTLKVVRALQSADSIFYDDLVDPSVLELARREAQRIAVGKRGYEASVRQQDIHELLIAHAREGKNVVRLKGGDPLMFGRLAEEIAALREAGIEPDVIPGISSAQGAAAALGISLTKRRSARQVQFVTGHDESGGLPGDLNWAAIADPASTTVLFMGRHTLTQFVSEALVRGLSPDTQAAAVAFATRPEEQRLIARLADLPRIVATLPEAAPVILLIGAVVRDAKLADRPASRAEAA